MSLAPEHVTGAVAIKVLPARNAESALTACTVTFNAGAHTHRHAASPNALTTHAATQQAADGPASTDRHNPMTVTTYDYATEENL